MVSVKHGYAFVYFTTSFLKDLQANVKICKIDLKNIFFKNWLKIIQFLFAAFVIAKELRLWFYKPHY